jgi:hypothetical protein
MHKAIALTWNWKNVLKRGYEERTNGQRFFHRWKIKNWAEQCGVKNSEQDVKKSCAKGTYHLWKPGMETFCGKLSVLHHLGLKNGRIMVSDKTEAKAIIVKFTLGLGAPSGLNLTDFFQRSAKKYISVHARMDFCCKLGRREKDTSALFTGKVTTRAIPTWTWSDLAVKNCVAFTYGSLGTGNSNFRKKGCIMIGNQNGLTCLRAPRLVKKNKFFWPALFPDGFVALRHLFLGEKPPHFARLALTTLDVLNDKKISVKEHIAIYLTTKKGSKDLVI